LARIVIRMSSRDFQRIERRLNRLPEAVMEGAGAAVRESSEAIRAQVERTVRVWRGLLRNKIRVREIGARGLTADVGWFDRDVYYAQFQEFGTSSITADPVLTRASLEEEREFPRRVRNEIERRL